MQNSHPSTTRKFFISQLQDIKRLPSSSSKRYRYRGIELVRVMIQGIVIHLDAQNHYAIIDDGTGCIEIKMTSFLANLPRSQLPYLQLGHYVAIIGPLTPIPSNRLGYVITPHQVIRLNTTPQAETMWFLEVIDYWHRYNIFGIGKANTTPVEA